MTLNTAAPAAPAETPAPELPGRFVGRLRAIALRALPEMYLDDRGLFVFRMRRDGGELVREGVSPRYTAITLIGLAGERDADAGRVLAQRTPRAVYAALSEGLATSANVGDVALAYWAGVVLDSPERWPVLDRLLQLRPADRPQPTVEVAWALTALSMDAETPEPACRELLFQRLSSGQNPDSGIFAHVLGRQRGLRSHVACFADMVYPIQALAAYFKASGDERALSAATSAADRICAAQGPRGQWWWHYDLRTGRVVETYPVYAVHQDAMAPMALFALGEAAGTSYADAIRRGLEWLESSPELGGGSLVDEERSVIWRKVARREPRKLGRYLQALASRVHAGARVPGLDVLLPPREIDYEWRPYHLGWLLYAFPESRLASESQ